MRGTNAEQKWLAGEAEAVHQCLDELNVPRAFNNEELSLWGRIVHFKNMDTSVEISGVPSSVVQNGGSGGTTDYDYISMGIPNPEILR